MKSLPALVLLVSVLGLHAQEPRDQPTFDVASIRRNTATGLRGAGLVGPQPGGRFVAVGVRLRELVSGAYDGMEVLGGPDWLDTDRFDVNARAPEDAGDRRRLCGCGS